MKPLPHHHNFHLPRPSFTSMQLAFSPIPREDDELIQAIDNQAAERNESWTLEARPDTDELEQYWGSVVTDIEHDPEWIRFAED